MISFEGLKELTIPEGNVTKIMSGNTIIWEKPEPWDYVILPYDGSEYGKLPAKFINVKAGQVVTIAYYLTERVGYVYDGRSCGLTYFGSVTGSQYPIPSDHIGSEQQVTITIATTGLLAISCYHTLTHYDGQLPQYDGDTCIGYYIKVKID